MERAWTFPPNTLCYFGTYRSYGSKVGTSYTNSFHDLYLRVKRTSKYWGNQWDDIVREATEHMNYSDERHRKYWDWNCPEGEVVGAHSRYVILTVGLEVRLFRWEQGFDESVDEGARRKFSPSSALGEFNPGRVLDIRETSDREEIEKFLDKAKELKGVIKAREGEKCGGEET